MEAIAARCLMQPFPEQEALPFLLLLGYLLYLYPAGHSGQHSGYSGQQGGSRQ